MNVDATYSVKSCNFDWHAPIPANTYLHALSIARARGWEARIECRGELVAVWSPLYGTKIYNRELAS
jgi:hypothetical protein